MVPNDIRDRYAREVAAAAGVVSVDVITALANVPRELFVGDPPWQILSLGAQYKVESKEVSQPEELYQNAAVMLDQSRSLTNGNPGTLVAWVDALALKQGSSVFHLGCGAGYYSAVMAEVVGRQGHVTAVEADSRLADLARKNLAAYSNVEVIAGDGGVLDPGPCDAILINAGVTHLRNEWLDSLNANGRLLVPLTADVGVPYVGKGVVVVVEKRKTGFSARLLPQPVMIYSCTSVREPSASDLVMKALTSGGMSAVKSLRRDPHEAGPGCWLHGNGSCLSTVSVD